jgi:hypothetical protein
VLACSFLLPFPFGGDGGLGGSFLLPLRFWDSLEVGPVGSKAPEVESSMGGAPDGPPGTNATAVSSEVANETLSMTNR